MSKTRSRAGGTADLLGALLRAGRASTVDVGEWRWVIDNRMRVYGEVDPNKFLVRINVKKHKCDRASLIDTLVHEELHILFPRFGETMICVMTERRLREMSKREKDRLYRRIRRR